MSAKQYTDWRGWWDGMRSKAMKAGAEAITTQLGAWFTTNAVATLPVDALHGVGLNYKTALVALVVQFMVRVIYAAALYVQQKPDPDVVTIDTGFVRKFADGSSVSQASSTKISAAPQPSTVLTNQPAPQTIPAQQTTNQDKNPL